MPDLSTRASMLAVALILGGYASAQLEPIGLDDAQAVSMTGKILKPAEPDQESLDRLEKARADHEADPDDADRIIWYGRRMAYTGDYQRAIAIFTDGIRKHPGDARMYRHRGHRQITIRDFRAAIADLKMAAQLIDGAENEIEPDGLPNAKNIPISSLHGNIWYHLGLAYYLTHDWDSAYRAFQSGFEAARNDDNIVSTTHWRYMILRRMGKHAEASDVLDDISIDMNVIENMVYHRLCLFYKGEISVGEMMENTADNPTGAAAAYGVANWHYYNGEIDVATAMMQELLTTDSWAAFGFIAAEADLASL